MSYIFEKTTEDNELLKAENIALKKEIDILKTANCQLKKQSEDYKRAYERYKNIFIIKIIRKILGKTDD